MPRTEAGCAFPKNEPDEKKLMACQRLSGKGTRRLDIFFTFGPS
ncbi:hypothetical protein [Pseudomonas brassicacearum]|nr:hypothetical protein [Pseudomonas brassicacearum]